jgi:hypothetical protein
MSEPSSNNAEKRSSWKVQPVLEKSLDELEDEEEERIGDDNQPSDKLRGR